MNLVGYLLALVFLFGCASNADRAKEHMEKENWEKAHEYWVKALKDDPNDKEVIEGKREAEFEITNKKLVQLRNLIKVGKSQQAVDLTWELNKLHMKWGYSSGHNISAFHDKQINALYPLFVRLIKTENYVKHPLKQYILVSRFEPIFVKRNLTQIREIKKEIEGRGKKFCLILRKGVSSKRPFHADMVSRVCHVFDHASEVQKTEDRQNPFLKSLASKATYQINIGGLPADLRDNFVSHMMSKAEATPYFNAVGTNNIKFEISGGISRKTKARTALRQKDYTKTETYKDYEDVYVDGKKQKKAVKKKREVTKTYTYYVNESTRTYTSNIKAKFDLGGRTQIVTLTDSDVQTIENHMNTFRPAGIFPVSEEFDSRTQAMERIIERFADKAKSQLEALWDRTYCMGDLPGGFTYATEKMMKCRMFPNSKNQKYLLWVETFFGLSHQDDVNDFEKLMGLTS